MPGEDRSPWGESPLHSSFAGTQGSHPGDLYLAHRPCSAHICNCLPHLGLPNLRVPEPKSSQGQEPAGLLTAFVGWGVYVCVYVCVAGPDAPVGWPRPLPFFVVPAFSSFCAFT